MIDIQVFNAGFHTWVKPSGVSVVQVILLAGGGGGGSGRVGLAGTVRYGGGGGAGGGYSERLILASVLGSTETVVVGAGGVGAPTQTNGSSNGIAGSPGEDTYFGTHIMAHGGQGGPGGKTYGIGNSGGRGRYGTGELGGNAGATPDGNQQWDVLAPSIGGAGGGGGGWISSTNVVNDAGVGGAFTGTGWLGRSVSGGAKGVSGGNGGDGVNALINDPIGGTGGGGGAASLSTNGGAGGNGGLYGCGGGGGAAAVDGFSSGAGANGTDGLAIIISW